MLNFAPTFSVVTGTQVNNALRDREQEVTAVVEEAYRLHGNALTVNPPSYFLRFPDRPADRIIALPASIGGPTPVDGIKWISSVPGNVERGFPRASAVLILNDPGTGYPIACMESSIISATRTAASAALAADRLTRERDRPTRVGFVGAGLIARYLHRYLVGTGWKFDTASVYDVRPEHARRFAGYLSTAAGGTEVRVCGSAEELVRHCDLILFATVASTPHITDPSWFDHRPVVLHVSLRDLGPDIILSSTNIVDDVEHCLKADTSVHVTEQRTGDRAFISGTLFDVMTGAVPVDPEKPVVFSPFGLGVLDLAVGRFVYDELQRSGELARVDGFFYELDRYAGATGPLS